VDIFIQDNPIESSNEDFLGRDTYTKKLAKDINEWKGGDTALVIALYGEWGSGKSSLINLTLNDIDKKNINVIQFNPWVFSETDNLLNRFIRELMIGLGGKIGPNKDIVKKLEYYLELLAIVPQKTELKTVLNNGILILALLGITVPQTIQFITRFPEILGKGLQAGVILCFSIILIHHIVIKIVSFLRVSSRYSEKSVSGLKREIKKLLKNKKLLIIIDDIDRLTKQEIRQIFKIIRVNADFSNTMYLLAFDRDVVEKNLEVQDNISGRDYLEKIVQVNFTLPIISNDKIHNYLWEEMLVIFHSLPGQIYDDYFNDMSYFSSIFDSGFKGFFRTIRDVKRYLNSLKFNISHLVQDNIIEVNPIDFSAIEVLRVFEPQCYSFMVTSKNIFFLAKMSLSQNENGHSLYKEHIKFVDKYFDKLVNEKNKAHLGKLLFELFPQIKEHHYFHGYNQRLRICSDETLFDSYFNFIPGGSEEEIGVFEIHQASIISGDYILLSQFLEKYKRNNSFYKFSKKMLNALVESDMFEEKHFGNIIHVLLDSFVDIPQRNIVSFEASVDFILSSLIYEFLKKKGGFDGDFQELKNAFDKTKSIYAPICFLDFIDKYEKLSDSYLRIPIEMVRELKWLSIKKICSRKHALLKEKNTIFILACWRKWDNASEDYKQYICGLLDDNGSFFEFLYKFKIEDVELFGSGTYGKFNFYSLIEIYDLESIKQKIIALKENEIIYAMHKSIIDLFLENCDKNHSVFPEL